MLTREQDKTLFKLRTASAMNPIELEWYHLKKDELSGQTLEDELDLSFFCHSPKTFAISGF